MLSNPGVSSLSTCYHFSNNFIVQLIIVIFIYNLQYSKRNTITTNKSYYTSSQRPLRPVELKFCNCNTYSQLTALRWTVCHHLIDETTNVRQKDENKLDYTRRVIAKGKAYVYTTWNTRKKEGKSIEKSNH